MVELAKVQNINCSVISFISERDNNGDDSGTWTLDGVLRTYNTASAMSLGFKLGNLLYSSSGSKDLAPLRNISVSTKPGLMLWGEKEQRFLYSLSNYIFVSQTNLFVTCAELTL
jgi:hypothetical protein